MGRTKADNVISGAEEIFLADLSTRASATAANVALITDPAAAGGLDTQVQFNDGGTTIGGDAGFVYNKTTNVGTIGGLNVSGLTASEIVVTDGSKNLASAAVATYPSLTELAHVKGVTSAIQTQINTKAPTTSPTFATSITGSYLTASEMVITDGSKNVVSAPVATYPSLTELTYLKGATSSVQTQINTKAPTASPTFTGTVTIPTPFTIGATSMTSTATELNILDGATLTTTELNYVDGVTSAIQTQLDAKAPTASPTFTGTVILPKTLEIQDTSANHQYVLAVNELTADRTVTLPLLTGNDTFVFNDFTQTLTNKRVTKRTGTTASSATPTINTDNVDFYSITALAAAITSFTTNLSGTPTEGQTLWIAITDNGTARALTWGASFEASGTVALPTTTVISTRLDVGFVWNTVTSKWRVVAVS